MYKITLILIVVLTIPSTALTRKQDLLLHTEGDCSPAVAYSTNVKIVCGLPAKMVRKIIQGYHRQNRFRINKLKQAFQKYRKESRKAYADLGQKIEKLTKLNRAGSTGRNQVLRQLQVQLKKTTRQAELAEQKMNHALRRLAKLQNKIDQKNQIIQRLKLARKLVDTFRKNRNLGSETRRKKLAASFTSGNFGEVISTVSERLASIKVDKKSAARNYAILGNTYYLSGQYKEALEAYRNALQLQPRNHQYWSMSAQTKYKLGMHLEAITDSSQSIKLYRYNRFGKHQQYVQYERIAKIYYELKNYPKSVYYYDRANFHVAFALSVPAVFKNRAAIVRRLYTELGHVLRIQGNYAGALQSLGSRNMYGRSIKKEKNPVSLYSDLGISYLMTGDLKKASKYLLKVIDRYKKATKIDKFNQAEVHYYTGRLMSTNKKWGEAIRYFNLALQYYSKNFEKQYPVIGDIYSRMGIVFVEQKDHTRALEYLEKARLAIRKRFGPDHLQLADTYISIASLYRKLGKYAQAKQQLDAAKSVYRKIKADQKKLGVLYMEFGFVYHKMNKDRLAVTYYERAIKILSFRVHSHNLSVNVARMYLRAGDIFFKLKDYSKALYHYAMGIPHAGKLSKSNPRLFKEMVRKADIANKIIRKMESGKK